MLFGKAADLSSNAGCYQALGGLRDYDDFPDGLRLAQPAHRIPKNAGGTIAPRESHLVVARDRGIGRVRGGAACFTPAQRR